jgi:hypothetical protein
MRRNRSDLALISSRRKGDLKAISSVIWYYRLRAWTGTAACWSDWHVKLSSLRALADVCSGSCKSFHYMSPPGPSLLVGWRMSHAAHLRWEHVAKSARALQWERHDRHDLRHSQANVVWCTGSFADQRALLGHCGEHIGPAAEEQRRPVPGVTATRRLRGDTERAASAAGCHELCT